MRKFREGVEEGGPHSDEEEGDEEDYAPGGCVLGRPEVEPVAAVGGGEEVVLEEDHKKEPLQGEEC